MYTYELSLKFNQNESELADKASFNYSPYQETLPNLHRQPVTIHIIIYNSKLTG